MTTFLSIVSVFFLFTPSSWAVKTALCPDSFQIQFSDFKRNVVNNAFMETAKDDNTGMFLAWSEFENQNNKKHSYKFEKTNASSGVCSYFDKKLGVKAEIRGTHKVPKLKVWLPSVTYVSTGGDAGMVEFDLMAHSYLKTYSKESGPITLKAIAVTTTYRDCGYGGCAYLETTVGWINSVSVK